MPDGCRLPPSTLVPLCNAGEKEGNELMWDKEIADEEAAAFKGDLEEKLASSPPEAVKFFEWLQREWESVYRTSGHKRLARVLLEVEVPDA